MAGLLSSVGAILRYASNVSEDGVAKGTLRTLEDKKMKLIRADGSMMKLLGNYIVEPVAVISDDLKDVEELDNILGLHMDMFTGYYMQVFDILRNQYGLSVTTIVDTLNTDNGGLTRVLIKGLELGTESADNHDFLGDLVKASTYTVDDLGNLSTEDAAADKAAKDKAGVEKVIADAQLKSDLALNATLAQKGHTHRLDKMLKADDREELKKLPKSKRIFYANRDTARDPVSLSETTKDLLIPNAIQRSIQITTEVAMEEPGTDGKFYTRKIVIPVTIKLAVIFTSISNIVNAIESKSDDYSFSDRLDQYRSGAISLSDFVLASDLISKHKRNKLKDKDNLLTLITDRELSGNSKMVTNGFAGFEKFYNMYLISPEAKSSIEKEIHGKLTSNGKDKFLDKGNGLSVTIVDPNYERIQIMLRDMRGKTDLSFKNAIKKDKNGSDYGEIIKALMSSKPPAF